MFFFTFLNLNLNLFSYCRSGTIVSILTPPCSSHPTHPHLPPLNLPRLALSMCPSYMFLDGPSPVIPYYPLPAPLWLLTVGSLFKCLWLYFACLFVLLIKELKYHGL